MHPKHVGARLAGHEPGGLGDLGRRDGSGQHTVGEHRGGEGDFVTVTGALAVGGHLGEPVTGGIGLGVGVWQLNQ